MALKRPPAWVLLVPLLVAVGGYFLEQSGWFAPMKQAMRSRSVPTAILNYGAFGKIIKQMGLVCAVPATKSKNATASDPEEPAPEILFVKKRQVGPYEFLANPGGRKNLPSSLVVKATDFRPGWPLISIVIREKDLDDPGTGLLNFPRNRGRRWERLAYVSYFEEGRLLFASGAGLRLHGGSSRTMRKRTSYRLYFRKEYGANYFSPGAFSQATNPLKHLVVHVDWPLDKPFTSCLAFDIARRMGCQTPEVKPALLLINGEFKGIYFLSEHVGHRQWQTRLGHDDFLFYEYRGNPDPESTRRYMELKDWAADPDTRMTREAAAQRVDLDNLIRNKFSYIFCGTDDDIQGAAVLNMRNSSARWFWINWDMDRSFWFHYDSRTKVLPQHIWEKYPFTFAVNPRATDVRSVLLRRLIHESPGFRTEFLRLVMELMNHRVTREYLLSRVAYYQGLARALGRKNLNSIEDLGRFCRNRPAFIRNQLQVYFQLDAPLQCRLEGDKQFSFQIDGYPEQGDYAGWYFKGQVISVVPTGRTRAKIAYWLVNGRKVTQPELRLPVTIATVIRPVLRKSS